MCPTSQMQFEPGNGKSLNIANCSLSISSSTINKIIDQLEQKLKFNNRYSHRRMYQLNICPGVKLFLMINRYLQLHFDCTTLLEEVEVMSQLVLFIFTKLKNILLCCYFLLTSALFAICFPDTIILNFFEILVSQAWLCIIHIDQFIFLHDYSMD